MCHIFIFYILFYSMLSQLLLLFYGALYIIIVIVSICLFTFCFFCCGLFGICIRGVHVCAIVPVCMHLACVGHWVMTLPWGCAGSCLNPQTRWTSGAEPCLWNHSTMRVRTHTHTHMQLSWNWPSYLIPHLECTLLTIVYVSGQTWFPFINILQYIRFFLWSYPNIWSLN